MVTDVAFIERQLPIGRLSAECYKERKANLGQTLPRLGKWWGRKPLVLVRASILGMLMPASDDAARDRDVFLRLMTMDDDAMWRRARSVQARRLGRAAFDALPYGERVRRGVRPEQLDGPDEESWRAINAHLGTSARSLVEVVRQLGERRFGRRPRIGDCFCGGGSVPFEAARLGCDASGSDLHPVAALLAWSSTRLLGGGPAVQAQVRAAQAAAFARADEQLRAWGIEHSEEGWRADAYLSCVEVTPPGSAYAIPLAPTWMIGERSRVIARLRRVPGEARLAIDIVTDPDDAGWDAAAGGTVARKRVRDPFDPARSWPTEALRGDGLRMWERDDLVPRAGDALQERLYCIRWRKPDGTTVYRAPTAHDLHQEARVLELLRGVLDDWWRAGVVPGGPMPDGAKTAEPRRNRGWTHWHHLFTPRQLLVNGLLASSMEAGTPELAAARMLATGRLANWNARLSRWSPDRDKELSMDVFSNHALNPMWSYSGRPLPRLDTAWPLFTDDVDVRIATQPRIRVADARDVTDEQDCWITDPPYADAVSYHELADFFLAWYEPQLPAVFPGVSAATRRARAVRGEGEDFTRGMIEIYAGLARRMPANGLQIVMFTHQDPSVWADLGVILGAAGLRVTAAWTVGTETPAGGTKQGRFVQGTVLLVLRRREAREDGAGAQVDALVDDETRRQIASMRALDDGGAATFGGADHPLAAYAAALRVLTRFATVDGRDVDRAGFERAIQRALALVSVGAAG